MQLSPEFLFAASIGAVAFLAGLIYLRRRTRRTRSVGLRMAGGPTNLRFTCAGCSGKFTHSRRTLAGWNKGTRSFYCNACHTKSQGSQDNELRSKSSKVAELKARVAAPDKGKKPGAGCLGIALLLVTVSVGLGYAATQYT
ncbi:MAG: hypothetical protein H7Y33_06190 [Cytophagales bacterium]|nr:hypothetical protein [Rhizobacter sp.]